MDNKSSSTETLKEKSIYLQNSALKTPTPLFAEGIGIHTGKTFQVELNEADPESGISIHSFFEGVPFHCPARWSRLSGTTRATALVMRGESRRKLEIRTIEHFMAAAFMSQLSDMDLYIQGTQGDENILEMPILDGSALTWWKVLAPYREKQSHRSPKQYWRAQRSFELNDGPKKVLITPLENENDLKTHFVCRTAFGDYWHQEMDFVIDWKNPSIAQEEFEKWIAPARTFGFKHEIDALRARGLALGGSLDNAIVLDGNQVVNGEGLRFPNEIAAHKLLDAIGDFALLEYPLIGRIELVQAGHSMHLRAIEGALRQGALIQYKIPA